MLSARRQSDGATVTAYFASSKDAPFHCLTCGDPVVLKSGRSKVSHFAHANPRPCSFSAGESDLHRRCKQEIALALRSEPSVSQVELEVPLGTVRPDVFAMIRGVPVAIEAQISSLSVETIMARTIEYHRKGIYVLWLLQWTPDLDAVRYSPRVWEKWIHACYFGQVFYWTHGLNVVSYHFEESPRIVPKRTWFSKDGRRQQAGGYVTRSARFKKAIRGRSYHLATDFVPKHRFWWEGNGVRVPDAKLFMPRISFDTKK